VVSLIRPTRFALNATVNEPSAAGAINVHPIPTDIQEIEGNRNNNASLIDETVRTVILKPGNLIGICQLAIKVLVEPVNDLTEQ